jgi:hypothetical protein
VLDRLGSPVEMERQVRLRVEVEEQRGDPAACQGGSEIHRGGRLTDPALLVDDRDPPQ